MALRKRNAMFGELSKQPAWLIMTRNVMALKSYSSDDMRRQGTGRLMNVKLHNFLRSSLIKSMQLDFYAMRADRREKHDNAQTAPQYKPPLPGPPHPIASTQVA
jgi:hypothetical protein